MIVDAAHRLDKVLHLVQSRGRNPHTGVEAERDVLRRRGLWSHVVAVVAVVVNGFRRPRKMGWLARARIDDTHGAQKFAIQPSVRAAADKKSPGQTRRHQLQTTQREVHDRP